MRRQYKVGPFWVKPLVFTAFIALLGGAYYAFEHYTMAPETEKPAPAVPSEVVLRLDPEMRVIAKRLNSDPCNRTLSFKFVGALLRDADYSSIIRLGQTLKGQCGPNQDLLGSIYSAQVLSSDYKNAEATGDEMVAAFPASTTAYAWRSQAREKNGNVQGAYEDMRIALTLVPDPKAIDLYSFYELARLADSAGNPCEAVAILRDYLAYDSQQRQTQQISTVMGEWQKKGACPSLIGSGTATLHYDTHAGGIVLPVEINGVTAKMVIDTGATRTVLTEQLADRAGIAHSDQRGASVMTANGPVWVAAGRANSMSLGGARLNNVPIFVQKASYGPGIDGLLGLSFLGNFQVRINNGTLELRQNS